MSKPYHTWLPFEWVTERGRHTKPGGYVEFQDMDFYLYSQDGSLQDSHALRRWDLLTFEAAEKTQRLLDPGPRLEQWVRDAGFVDVHVVKTPVPIGLWPSNKRLVSFCSGRPGSLRSVRTSLTSRAEENWPLELDTALGGYSGHESEALRPVVGLVSGRNGHSTRRCQERPERS